MYKEEATTYWKDSELKYKRNKVVEVGSIKDFDSEAERYYSLFTFDESFVEYVKVQGTVMNFKGKAWCECFWIDLDNKDLNKSHSDTILLVKKLNEIYGLSTSDMFIYFSGNKGFHIGIHSKVFGGFEASIELPDRIKILAETVCKGVESFDSSIYEKVRIFRKENSKNWKSNLYKIEISYEELLMGLDTIKIKAEKPREFIRKKSISSIYVNELLAKEWNNILNTDLTAPTAKEGAKEDREFWKPTEDGDRHKQLYRQAAQLFDHSDLSKTAIYELMYAMNQLCKPPITDLQVLIDSAYKKTNGNVKKSKSEIIVKPFSGWVDEYLDHLFHPSSEMTTGFPSFDSILRKRLKGKLGCIIGYGGSKKSLFALNSCLKNIYYHGCTAIYSTMEMAAPELIDRIVDYMVEVDYGNASVEIEKAGREQARKLLVEQVSPLLGTKLYITQNSSLTCEGYDKILTDVTSQTGRVDMLVVDGLSMMGGKGSETEKYSDNTRDLKEVANKWNIYIQLMCHVSKGADRHTRDLVDKVRGSEKILDNCDFVVIMSQIIDEQNSTAETIEYRHDKGYARLYDKRGSGRTCNKIYNFTSTRLMLDETSEDPKYYEVKKQKRNNSNDFEL